MFRKQKFLKGMTARQTNRECIRQHFYFTILLTIKYGKNLLKSHSLEKGQHKSVKL